MEQYEKTILKTACNNLRRATEIPKTFGSLHDYQEWIRTANRASMDLVNIVDTLITGGDSKSDKEKITL